MSCPRRKEQSISRKRSRSRGDGPERSWRSYACCSARIRETNTDEDLGLGKETLNVGWRSAGSRLQASNDRPGAVGEAMRAAMHGCRDCAWFHISVLDPERGIAHEILRRVD